MVHKSGQAVLYVLDKQCDECLFSPNRIVSPERFVEILETCKAKDTHFICHKATLVDETLNVCCRGYYDIIGDRVLEIRLANHILHNVVFVTEAELDELP